MKLPPLAKASKTSADTAEDSRTAAAEEQAEPTPAPAPAPIEGQPAEDHMSKSIPLSEAAKPPPVDTATSAQESAAESDNAEPRVLPPMSPFVAIWKDPQVLKLMKRNFSLAWKINKCFSLFYVFLVMSFVLGYIEGWTPLDSFYYAIVTGTTVGYGDVAPITKAGRIFATFLLPFGMVGVSNALGSIASVFEDEKAGAGETLMDKVQELEKIIAEDDDGTVTEEEFTIFQVTKLYNIDEQTLNSVRNQFKSLDADGSGELDQDDIIQLKATCTKLGIKSSSGAQHLFRRLSAHLPRRLSKIALGDSSKASKYSKQEDTPVPQIQCDSK